MHSLVYGCFVGWSVVDSTLYKQKCKKFLLNLCRTCIYTCYTFIYLYIKVYLYTAVLYLCILFFFTFFPIKDPPMPVNSGSLVQSIGVTYNSFILQIDSRMFNDSNGPISNVGVLVSKNGWFFLLFSLSEHKGE